MLKGLSIKSNLEQIPLMQLVIVVLFLLTSQIGYGYLTNSNLQFLLLPTKSLISFISGYQFSFQEDFGYVEQSHRFRINKSCSGFIFLNLLLSVAFLLLNLRLKATISLFKKLILSFITFLLAYTICLICNSSRILIGIKMQQFSMNNSWFPNIFLHEVIGIIYFGFSVVIFSLKINQLIKKWNV